MSNKYTELNLGAGGSVMDESGLVYAVPGEPTDRRRARIILAGDNINDITQIKNIQVSGNEYGLITRNIPFCPATSNIIYDTVSTVAANNLTVITTYTVPSGKTFYFKGFAGTGDVPAIYRIYVDGSPQMVVRTTAASPNASLIYDTPVFQVATATIITLEVIHYTAGVNGDFEGSIIGFLI